MYYTVYFTCVLLTVSHVVHCVLHFLVCSHIFKVTTRSPLMTQEELKAVAESLSVGFAHFDLLEFDTELDFSNKIGSVVDKLDVTTQFLSLVFVFLQA